MNTYASRRILFDGVCKVRTPTPSAVGHQKKSMFINRNDWKSRYCLLSQGNYGDGSNEGMDTTLTIYKSKKILMTNAREKAKISLILEVDARLTVLAEDGLTGFLFHLHRNDTSLSLSCETKYIRDSWVATIQAHLTPPNNAAIKSPAKENIVDNSDQADDSRNESSAITSPTVENGSEMKALKITQQMSSSETSQGLELKISCDKPTSKSMAIANACKTESNQPAGVRNIFSVTRRSKTESDIRTNEDEDFPILPSFTRQPSAPLPLKPPPPTHSIVNALTSPIAEVKSPHSVTTQSTTRSQDQDDNLEPLWMSAIREKMSDHNPQITSFQGSEVHDISTDFSVKSPLGSTSTVMPKDIEFLRSYSIFDSEHLNKVGGFKSHSSKQTLRRECSTHTSGDNEKDEDKRPSSCEKAIISEIDDDDDAFDPTGKIALLRSEIKSLVKLNNELNVELEQVSFEKEQQGIKDRKLSNTLYAEINKLSLSNKALSEQNNHLSDKIKVANSDIKDLELKYQDKEKRCLKYESDMETMGSYKQLTESLTCDNTELLKELEKMQMLVQKGMDNEECLNRDKKVLLDQLNNSSATQKKNLDEFKALKEANEDLTLNNEKLLQNLNEMTKQFEIAELELENLRSRVHSEVLEEVSNECFQIQTLKSENSLFKQQLEELQKDITKYNSECICLQREIDNKDAHIQKLSEDNNLERTKALSFNVAELTRELELCKSQLADKRKSLEAVEDKLVSEEKKSFDLTIIVEELRRDLAKSDMSHKAALNELSTSLDEQHVQNSKMETELKEVQKRCSAYKLSIHELEEELRKEYESRLQDRMEFNKNRLDLTDAVNKEAQSTRISARRIEELEKDIESLKRKASEQSSAEISLRTDVKELQVALDKSNLLLCAELRKNKELTSDNECLRDNTEGICKRHHKLEEDLRREVVELEHTLASTKSKLKDALQHIKENNKSYKAKVTELNESLQQADERCKDMSESVIRLERARKRENEEAEHLLCTSQGKIRTLTSKLEEVQDELNMKTLDLNSHLERITSLQREAENKGILDRKLAEMQTKFSQSEKNVAALNEKIENFEDAVKKSNHAIQQRDATIATLESNCTELRTTVADLKYRAQHDEKAINAAKLEKGSLEKRCVELSESLQISDTKLKMENNKFQDVSDRLNCARTELEKKEDEIRRLNDKVSSLQNSLEACESRLGASTAQNNTLQCDILSLKKKEVAINDLEKKAEQDNEVILTLRKECSLLRKNIDQLDILNIKNEDIIATLRSKLSAVPDLERRLEELSKAQDFKLLLEKNVKELEHIHQEQTDEISALQMEISTLHDQAKDDASVYAANLKAMERDSESKTYDLNMAFDAIKEVVAFSFVGSSELVMGDKDVNINDMYDRLISSSGPSDEDGKKTGCDELSSYCNLLIETIKHIILSCTEGRKRLSEVKPRIIKSNSQLQQVIVELTSQLSSKSKSSCDTLQQIKCLDDINDHFCHAPDLDGGLDLPNFVRRLLFSFDIFINDVLQRNSVIEALCKEIILLNDNNSAVVDELRQVKSSAYSFELDASKFKRERDRMESILRSKLTSEEFYLFSKKSDLWDQYYISKCDEKDWTTCSRSVSPHRIEFGSSIGEVRDDCASSLSWCSEDDCLPLGKDHLLKAGRAARVSLRNRKSSDGIIKIEDIFTPVDGMLEL